MGGSDEPDSDQVPRAAGAAFPLQTRMKKASTAESLAALLQVEERNHHPLFAPRWTKSCLPNGGQFERGRRSGRPQAWWQPASKGYVPGTKAAVERLWALILAYLLILAYFKGATVAERRVNCRIGWIISERRR